MQKLIWSAHKLCILVLVLIFALAATYIYDIATFFHQFGANSDDCHETTGFVLFYISPVWFIIVAISIWGLFSLSKGMRSLRNR